MSATAGGPPAGYRRSSPGGTRAVPRYRDCCILLRPVIGRTGEYGPPGGALWLRRFRPSGYELIAAAVNLPPPREFGGAFNAYVLTGTIIPPREMQQVSEGFWVETPRFEDIPVPYAARFEVRPGTGFQPGEPVVLRGFVARCRD